MSINRTIRTKGIIAGVCSGLAQDDNIIAWILRIIIIVLSIFFILPIVIYLMLWLIIPSEKIVIDGDNRNLLYTKHLPTWFVILSYMGLLGIAFWPFILFGSVFMFDYTETPNKTFIQFLLINSYPVIFITFFLLGLKFYPKNKELAILFPSLALLLSLFLICVFFRLALS